MFDTSTLTVQGKKFGTIVTLYKSSSITELVRFKVYFLQDQMINLKFIFDGVVGKAIEMVI